VGVVTGRRSFWDQSQDTNIIMEIVNGLDHQLSPMFLKDILN